MPGVKYYLRQANAFLSHAQSITDSQLRARYRMMTQKYRDMASESAGEPEEVASETDDRHGPPSPRARFPTPVIAKAGPMPPNKRLRLDDREDLQNRRKPSI
jgi:hypothetical protein